MKVNLQLEWDLDELEPGDLIIDNNGGHYLIYCHRGIFGNDNAGYEHKDSYNLILIGEAEKFSNFYVDNTSTIAELFEENVEIASVIKKNQLILTTIQN